MSCKSTVVHKSPTKPHVKVVPGKLYMFKYEGASEPDSKSIILLASQHSVVTVHVGDRIGCSDRIGGSCWLKANCLTTLEQFEELFQPQLFPFSETVTLTQP